MTDSMRVDGCYVAGEITHSILSQNVRVGNGSVVRDSLIMANVTIGENVTIEHAIIGENAKIADNANVIGKNGEIEVVGYAEVIGGLKDEDEEYLCHIKPDRGRKSVETFDAGPPDCFTTVR